MKTFICRLVAVAVLSAGFSVAQAKAPIVIIGKDKAPIIIIGKDKR